MERVTLTIKEWKRARVLHDLQEGRITGTQTAQVLGLSLRQVWRLAKSYREKGEQGLAHGNRLRPSPRRVSESVRKAVLQLATTTFRDYNDPRTCSGTHAAPY